MLEQSAILVLKALDLSLSTETSCNHPRWPLKHLNKPTCWGFRRTWRQIGRSTIRRVTFQAVNFNTSCRIAYAGQGAGCHVEATSKSHRTFRLCKCSSWLITTRACLSQTSSACIGCIATEAAQGGWPPFSSTAFFAMRATNYESCQSDQFRQTIETPVVFHDRHH